MQQVARKPGNIVLSFLNLFFCKLTCTRFTFVVIHGMPIVPREVSPTTVPFLSGGKHLFSNGPLPRNSVKTAATLG